MFSVVFVSMQVWNEKRRGGGTYQFLGFGVGGSWLHFLSVPCWMVVVDELWMVDRWVEEDGSI
jgi:hypothetical protein